jgi:hypothetical protein
MRHGRRFCCFVQEKPRLSDPQRGHYSRAQQLRTDLYDPLMTRIAAACFVNLVWSSKRLIFSLLSLPRHFGTNM